LFSVFLVFAGSHDAHGLRQLAAHMRMVPEEFRCVDRSPVHTGIFHHVRVAERRGVPIFRPVGAHGHIDSVRVGQHIVLLPDICLLQKR